MTSYDIEAMTTNAPCNTAFLVVEAPGEATPFEGNALAWREMTLHEASASLFDCDSLTLADRRLFDVIACPKANGRNLLPTGQTIEIRGERKEYCTSVY